MTDASRSRWLTAHAVELAFVADGGAFWFGYVLHLAHGLYSFWSDDLPVLRQAGSWSHLLRPYNGALSATSLVIDRIAAEVGHLSFTPFMLAGVVSLAAASVSFFFTTKRQFGAWLAAMLAMPLLWFHGTSLRPANLNHLLALVGGIFCAAALNRGRRADAVLAGALAFSLASAGGGLVVAGACLVHNVLVRPPVRRWLAVLVPLALYGLWYVVVNPSVRAPDSPSLSQAVRIVRDLVLAPFYQVGFQHWPLAALLLIAFLVWGGLQLRRGLVAGSNFLAWTAALVGWSMALVQSRGSTATATTFRYGFVALGFVLLAIVPRRPIRWPAALSASNRAWALAAVVIVFGYAGLRVVHARPSLQADARNYAELGRKARGTMLVLSLGPTVIPDDAQITFFGVGYPHGTAGELRRMVERYGTPFRASRRTVDRTLVDQRIADSRVIGSGPGPGSGCQPLQGPVAVRPTSFREADLGLLPQTQLQSLGPLAYQLWAPKPYTLEVRRFGHRWIPMRDVTAQTDVTVTLPVLNTSTPWEIKAPGACFVPYRAGG